MVSLKMQATANAKGFTLVELIVVITILAILGTIGFISLQGYSAQSRDSKRTSDLRSLSTAVTTKNTEGLSLLSFVGTQGNLVTTRSLSGTGTAGVISTAGTTQNYTAGTPNNTVLGINAANFNDPNTSAPYKIGATTLAGGAFQLAAKLEGSGTPTSTVTGNYNARTSQTFATTAATAQTIVTLPSTAVGYFKKGDFVSATAGVPAGTTIAAISGDSLTVTLSQNLTGANPAAFTLANGAEMNGLIGTTGGTAITNNDTTNLPY